VLFSEVGGRDASPPGRGELLDENLEPGCNRHADDHSIDPDERSERQHAHEHGETREVGSPSDDRRLFTQNV